MRVMMIVKGDTQPGQLPSEENLEAMGKYNEELVKAGVMLAGDGLQPSSKGARVRFSGEKRTVIDGPFAETKELIAGFWIIETGSFAEAVAWMKKAPMEKGDVLEIRQVFEADDFGPEFTPELREQEERLRARLEEQQS